MLDNVHVNACFNFRHAPSAVVDSYRDAHGNAVVRIALLSVILSDDQAKQLEEATRRLRHEGQRPAPNPMGTFREACNEGMPELQNTESTRDA